MSATTAVIRAYRSVAIRINIYEPNPFNYAMHFLIDGFFDYTNCVV